MHCKKTKTVLKYTSKIHPYTKKILKTRNNYVNLYVADDTETPQRDPNDSYFRYGSFIEVQSKSIRKRKHEWLVYRMNSVNPIKLGIFRMKRNFGQC